MVFGMVCARLKQSVLIGYLLAGALLGPHALKVIQSEKDVETIAELGVALLLFGIGLEFSWKQLKALGGRTLMAGAVQVVITAVVSALAATLFHIPGREAIVVGAMVSLSSTACVLRVLMDRAEIDSLHGRNVLAVLLIQDMAIVPLAILINVLGGDGQFGDVMLDLGRLSLWAFGLIVALYLLLNKLSVWVMGTLVMARNRDLTVLLAVVIGLGATWASHAAGLSPALGAFVAGMCLGGSPFATQVRADVSSLRTILLTLFFAAAGMLASPLWIADHWQLVTLLVIAVVFFKSVIVWAIFRSLGHSHMNALSTGICLAQVGEFGLVIGQMANSAGVLTDNVFMAIISVTIVTLFISPYLVSFSPKVGAWFEHRLTGGHIADQGETVHRANTKVSFDLVIIGFGPAGQAVGEAVFGADINVVVVDQNPNAKLSCKQFGFAFHLGDATQHEVLSEIGIIHAKVVVITLPDQVAAQTIVAEVRRLAPHTQLIVRSRYHIHKWAFKLDGAHVVVDEEYEVGRRMADYVKKELTVFEQQDNNEESLVPKEIK
jgi:monovalent cation:H+ antiporter-2, CPA2 family